MSAPPSPSSSGFPSGSSSGAPSLRDLTDAIQERSGVRGVVIVGADGLSPVEKAAMATAYITLMTDVMLDLLGTKGEIIVEGSFSTNPLFAPILATLRPGQSISVSDDRAGTVGGARLLALGVKRSEARTSPVAPLPGIDLIGYRRSWQGKV